MLGQFYHGIYHSWECGHVVCLFFFFFKQKTAYEMRVSDWSSDVCSSDLRPMQVDQDHMAQGMRESSWSRGFTAFACRIVEAMRSGKKTVEEIGRASCRERVCQYV